MSTLLTLLYLINYEQFSRPHISNISIGTHKPIGRKDEL